MLRKQENIMLHEAWTFSKGLFPSNRKSSTGENENGKRQRNHLTNNIRDSISDLSSNMRS